MWVRVLTFIWGFSVIYLFTGKLDFTSKVFLVQVIGNTIIMWAILKQKRKYQNIYGKIGKRNKIAEFVEIGGEVGDGCSIQAFVFIPKGVQIMNKVFIGPHTCFTNDKYPKAQGDWEQLETIVEDEVSIGANCTILPGIHIHKRAVIGAGSVVTKDIPEGGKWIG